jgi:hypothetical protein
MKKWITNLAGVLLAGLVIWGMTCYIPREATAAGLQFE